MLRPPRPRDHIEDVGAAVRDALAFPLAGRAARGARDARRHGDDRDRAAVAADPGGTGRPAARDDRRGLPTSSTGSASQRVTILVAGGLLRRTTPREIGLLVPPEFRRRFKGRVIVHDAEAEDLVDLGVDRQRHAARQPGARRDRPRRHRDRGRDGAARRPGRPARGERPRVAARRRRALAARDERVAGLAARRRDRAAARRARRGHRRLARPEPAARRRPVRRLPARPRGGRAAARLARRAGSSSSRRAACASACSSGCRASRRPRPSTAARRRSRTPRRSCAARSSRAIELDEPVDALVIGIPPTTPFMPRERPNPVSAAYLGLGLALRLWRNRRRSRRAARRSSCTRSRGASRGRRRRRTARSSSTRGRRATSARCATRKPPRSSDARAIDGLPRGPRLPPAAAVRRVERLRRRPRTGSERC